MRAARYIAAGQIDVVDVDPIEPGPAEVRIEVAYSGICGTDLHILHGAMDHRVHAPQVIGHEMSGRVAALGPDVTGWSVGQPVTAVFLASFASDYVNGSTVTVDGGWLER
ncbi:alcohol dehydrogenase catalytic domain-containing protein [Asanoa sp. NPDC049518]|uniref:alcohol dehydrogenase catalytic domain-containing protein n=1 Tax=unclassified Asanoa TaxID=2685164 RepID=UPI003426EE4E